MIKSLLDSDENPPPGTKVVIEETVVAPSPKAAAEISAAAQPDDTENILEIPQSDARAESIAEISESPTAANNSQPDFQILSESPKSENEVSFPFQTAYFEPESQSETARKSGLAYAAGITLFASVVFMMIIGWGADLLLGTTPWGVVGGIVLGALIGFIQFFRLTGQILKNKD
jgi:hypothetical protein